MQWSEFEGWLLVSLKNFAVKHQVNRSAELENILSKIEARKECN